MDDSNLIASTIPFWEKIYKQNINKMIGVGYRYTADKQIAEDLAHDAFLIAYEKADTYQGKGPFEAWLRRILVNICLQFIRKQNKNKCLIDLFHNETDTMETPEEKQSNTIEDFTEDELLEALNQLPEHHKMVFNMYVIDKFTHAQIGKELAISEGTSKSHLARARKKMKELLNEKLESNHKKKSAFLLLFWNVDRLYHKRFDKFEIANHKDFSFNSLHNSMETPAILNPAIPLISPFSGLGIASMISGLALVSYFIFQTSISPSPHFENFVNNQTTTATISEKAIISNENSDLNNNLKDMKNLKNIGKVLVASAGLALPSIGQTQSKTESNSSATPQVKVETKAVSRIDSNTDVVVSNQNEVQTNLNARVQVISNVKSEVNPNENTNLNTDSGNLSGTFYSEKLRWSAEDNKIYFEGKSIVNFGRNNFVSANEATFLGKVYYLVFEGKPALLGASIKLSQKKYNLSQLSPESAMKKYGDDGKKGAIEVSLAE